MILTHFGLRICAALALAAMASAACVADAPRPTADEVDIRFRVVTWEPQLPSAIRYLSAGETVLIDRLNNSLRSPFFKYRGPADFVLFPGPEKGARALDPEALPAPLARVTLPEGIKTALLLLAPTPDGANSFEALVINDAPSAFPFDSYLFVNRCSRKITIKIADHKQIIEPGTRYLLTNSDHSKAMHLIVSVQTDDGWQTVSDGFYPRWPNLRTAMFIHETTQNGRLRVKLRSLIENEAVWKAADQSAREGPVGAPGSENADVEPHTR